MRLAVVALLALALAPPVSAQNGGTIVLTSDVVSRLITGLKAGEAERERAKTADTPFGRYQKAKAEYAAAKDKCQAAQQPFGARMANDEKLMAKYSKLQEQQLAALQKGDQKAAAVYQDQLLAMVDPSCTVKEPERPADYYEGQRGIDTLADKAVAKASGFSPGELAMIQERTLAILQGATAPDISASEKSAVRARSAELKPLLGIQDQPAATAAAPAPEPAPAPVAAAAPAPTPEMSAEASAMSDCMMKNMQTHQKELEALGKRMQAAQGDTRKLMAMADTAQRIQMAGCQKR